MSVDLDWVLCFVTSGVDVYGSAELYGTGELVAAINAEIARAVAVEREACAAELDRFTEHFRLDGGDAMNPAVVPALAAGIRGRGAA